MGFTTNSSKGKGNYESCCFNQKTNSFIKKAIWTVTKLHKLTVIKIHGELNMMYEHFGERFPNIASSFEHLTKQTSSRLVKMANKEIVKLLVCLLELVQAWWSLLLYVQLKGTMGNGNKRCDIAKEYVLPKVGDLTYFVQTWCLHHRLHKTQNRSHSWRNKRF